MTKRRKKHKKQYKYLYKNPNVLRWWQKFFLLVIVLSLVEFIVEIFVEYPHALKEVMHVFHIVVIMMIMTDLLFEYIQADGKKDFLKKHWIEIIAIFPWGAIGRGARLTEMVAEGSRVTRVGLEARRLQKEARAKMRPRVVTKSRRNAKKAVKKKSSRSLSR